MAKGNPLMGTLQGKLGDAVYFRTGGEQRSRTYIRNPRNPQSALQLLQRVLLKTYSGGYSYFKALADHSFQGFATGTPNQSRFMSLNVDFMRRALAEYINSGNPNDLFDVAIGNFAGKISEGCEILPYILSDGSLTPLNVGYIRLVETDPAMFSIVLGSVPSGFNPTASYAQMCSVLGVQQGDQLTFVQTTYDDSDSAVLPGCFNGLYYARVIMEPSDGDMAKAFFVNAGGTDMQINDPNSKNEGFIRFTMNAGNLNNIIFKVGDFAWNQVGLARVGAACIVSRRSGNTWMRSRSQLFLLPSEVAPVDYNYDLLGDAMLSFLTAANSTLYLNQAEG